MQKYIREPSQKRAVETKDKIILAGLELICTNGYYKTNTAEIAKKAGVSTGIVYQYFNDKHDIVLAALEKYNDVIFFSTDNIPKETLNPDNLPIVVRDVVNKWVKARSTSFRFLKELNLLAHQDEEIDKAFKNQERKILDIFENSLENSTFPHNNIKEKSIIIIGMLRNLCHEIVYYKHPGIDKEKIIDITIQNIINILNTKEPI